MSKKEIWKDIKRYEGLYQVSNLGRVKSLYRVIKKTKGTMTVHEKILNQYYLRDKYAYVDLSLNSTKKRFFIHRLLAETFLNHKPKKTNLVVDHLDNDSRNNSLSNLQLVTIRENTVKEKKPKSGYNYAYKNGSGYTSRVHFNNKLHNLGTYKTPKEANEIALKFIKTKTKKNENNLVGGKR